MNVFIVLACLTTTAFAVEKYKDVDRNLFYLNEVYTESFFINNSNAGSNVCNDPYMGGKSGYEVSKEMAETLAISKCNKAKNDKCVIIDTYISADYTEFGCEATSNVAGMRKY